MVKIKHQSAGKFAPVLVCDQCRKPINDASKAFVVWALPLAVGDVAFGFGVHGGTCLVKFKKELGKVHGIERLDAWLWRLCSGVGLTARFEDVVARPRGVRRAKT